MLGVEAHVLMAEEEDVLRQMVHQTTLDTQEVSSSAVDIPPEDYEDIHFEDSKLDLQGYAEDLNPGPHGGGLVGENQQLDDFAHHHHLTRSQVQGLLMILGPHYSNPGRRAPLKDFVLTSLVVLSSSSNYRELNESKLFKSRGWMHKTIHQFCKMLVQHLSTLIEWPSGDYAQQTLQQFESISGLPGVLGALDSCHMPITKAPVGSNSKSYSNHMLFHSIHLLAVADARARFTYVNIGRPGSLHESKVLKRSSLYQALEGDPGGVFPPNSHIIADKAFPLTDHLITPYPEGVAQTAEQNSFNIKLYETRQPVTAAVQLLRARWLRLKCLEMDEVQSMVQLVKSCCILHNICCDNTGYRGANCPLEDREDVEVEHVADTVLMSAVQKRDMLAMYMSGHTITLNIQ